MDTNEVGKKLVALCRENKHDEAMNTLYADDCVQVEASGPPGAPREFVGLPAIQKMSEEWYKSVKMYGFSTSDPQVHGDRFALWMEIDMEIPGVMPRAKHHEIGLYTVKNGKVSRIEFFSEPMNCG